MKFPDKRIALYREMAALTKTKCAGKGLGACNPKLSCCSPEYCAMAREYAQDAYGVKLEATGHPTLPLMGPTGCVAEPHYRRLCSVHVCERAYMLDADFSKKYFKLRGKLNELESE